MVRPRAVGREDSDGTLHVLEDTDLPEVSQETRPAPLQNPNPVSRKDGQA